VDSVSSGPVAVTSVGPMTWLVTDPTREVASTSGPKGEPLAPEMVPLRSLPLLTVRDGHTPPLVSCREAQHARARPGLERPDDTHDCRQDI